MIRLDETLFIVDISQRRLQTIMLTWLKLLIANAGQTFKLPPCGENAKV